MPASVFAAEVPAAATRPRNLSLTLCYGQGEGTETYSRFEANALPPLGSVDFRGKKVIRDSFANFLLRHPEQREGSTRSDFLLMGVAKSNRFV